MTDAETRAKLERIKKAVDIHVSWLKLQTGDWESHSMGVPVKDAVLLLNTIAESQRALREIVGLLQHQLENEDPDDLVTILQLLDVLMSIAKNACKEKSNG